MKILGTLIAGKFDSIKVRDGAHWENVRNVRGNWTWEKDGRRHSETMLLEEGFIWDGSSRPDWIGWLVPRGGVFLLPSGFHDKAFKTRFKLSDGTRITRQHADLLFLALMRHVAAERVTSGWKAPAQVALAEVMYRTVRLFGEPTWDAHDGEFAA